MMGVSLAEFAKGNCGIPAYVDGSIRYHSTSELMGDYACFARDSGTKIIGGCCGTAPEHVAAMAVARVGAPSHPFDEVAAEAELGTIWKDLPTPPAGEDDAAPRRSRGHRP
jgi:hypothetical protein